MKRFLFILVIALLLPTLAVAREGFSVTFSPQTINVNSFNSASFDPFDPDQQPILTHLTIDTGTVPKKIDLKLVLEWNNINLVETIFSSINTQNSWKLTNRDLITNEASTYFDYKEGYAKITVKDAIENSSTLKSAVLAGYFPDGVLKFKVWVREFSTAPWTNDPNLPYDEFKIIIRNAGNITLLSLEFLLVKHQL